MMTDHLPQAATTAPADAQRDDGQEPVVLDGRSILVVDDDDDIRHTMATLLKFIGYRALLAEDGVGALKILAESANEKDPNHRVGLVLLDVMMPWLNGNDLCWMIKEKYQVPIIMVTAKGTRGDVVRAMETGANDYIVKPFPKDVLIGKISKWLPKPNGAG